ncbi:MAG: NADH-quinone oxidoreductase subunit C [Verrucomicrobia bacterium]|nr:NADH-quinone oxidoreductase subunit C [Verrucomicrobiota bacterium]
MELTALRTRFAELAASTAETSHAARGVDLDVTVSPERIADAVRILDEEEFMIEAITGVDWMAEGQMEVVYDFTDAESGTRVVIRARVPREKPELPTVSAIYPGANWHEREAHDFFGILFRGHPQLEPLLLPEDALFHPLRKDFKK